MPSVVSAAALAVSSIIGLGLPALGAVQHGLKMLVLAVRKN
jgi:hypothetical protein